MSGHSKWHNIRLKKQKVDLVRGKLFSKLAREIAVAAKEGGGDPDGNPRLRTAIDHGREAGMPNAKEDDVLSTPLEAGAEDIRTSGDVYEIVTSPEQFFKVKQAMERARLPIASADITMVPKSTVRVEGKDAHQVLRLMEALEEHDDVQHAYANFDIPDEILQQVG